MFRRRIDIKLLALLVGAVALPASALDSDRQQPVELTASRAEMNQATGVGVYTGNVVLSQGTMRITADKMTVHTTPGGDLARVVAEGDNASFRQLPEGQKEYVNARAPYMEYVPQAPGHVLLQGGAILTQGKNEFTGQVIRYDMQRDIVIADAGKNGDERIRITFFPEKKQAGDAPNKDNGEQ